MATVDASIPLSIKKPEFMSPAQAISLQNMVQQMQFNKLQQAQLLQTTAKQNQIQQIASQPGATDEKGILTLDAINKIRGIDWTAGEKAAGMRLHTLDELAAANSRMLQDNNARLNLQKHLEEDQKDILSSVISQVEIEMPNAPMEEKDRRTREIYQSKWADRAKAGTGVYTPEQLERMKNYPITYADAKGRTQKPADTSKSLYEERDVPLKGDMMQKEYRNSPTEPWKPLGAPTHKFGKQVLSLDQGTGVQPTDDTLEMDAYRYLTDGTLPPNMGRGIQGTKQATTIRNKASELAKQMGMSMDEIRYAQLENKTKVAALGQLAKAKAQILQFEKTAEANAELALQAGRDVWRSNSPWLNKPLNVIKQQGAGDPKFAVFNAANETFVNEYARVMSGGYGAAQTTEGAQQRAHGLLNTSMSLPQYEAVVKQLKAEMKNREKALNDQMEEERNNLRGVKVKPYNPNNQGSGITSSDNRSQSQQDWSDEDEKRLQELEKKRGAK